MSGEIDGSVNRPVDGVQVQKVDSRGAETVRTPELLVNIPGQNTPVAHDAVHVDDKGRDIEGLPEVRLEHDRLGRYVVLGMIGQGGMGTVLEAFDRSLDRRVALKVLYRDLSEESRKRLMREAKALARLSHPNVVQVYEVGEAQGRTFIAMELVRGQTLKEWSQRQSRLGWRECVEVYRQAGEGLAAAHAQGLVHRDFKPSNAVIDDNGRVRVLDFGLARESGNSALKGKSGAQGDVDADITEALGHPLTQTGVIMGTLAYMPLEQMCGEETNARSDQFSFCVSLYEALYGKRPFEGGTVAQLTRSMTSVGVSSPPNGNWIHGRLKKALLRGLSVSPEDRWSSMDELLGELGRIAPSRRVILASLDLIRTEWHLMLVEFVRISKARRRLWVTLVIAGVSAALAFQLGKSVTSEHLEQRAMHSDPQCRDSESYLDGLWDGGVRESVRRSILETELPYAAHTWSAVELRLDSYLQRWVAIHREACEANRIRGEQSDELFDLRMICLQNRLGESRAVLSILREADFRVVQRAVTIVAELPKLDQCVDIKNLASQISLPEDDSIRDRAEELRGQILQAQSLQSVRRVEEARELAEEVLKESRSLGYEPLRVEALVTLGVVLDKAGDYDESEARLRQALWGAMGIGYDHFSVRAATQLVSVVGDRLARFDEGLIWAELAGALLDREGKNGATRVSLMNNLGNIWYRKGDHAKALDHYQRALVQLEELSSADDPTLAGDRINLGNAQLALGQHDAALASYQQAEIGLRTALGEGHPQVAMAVASIGVVYNETGRYAEALVQHREALDDFEAWLGPEHLFVATTIGNIGVALLGQGKLDEAQGQIRRSQRMLEKSLGPDHPHVAASLHNLGTIRKEQRHYGEALRLYQRAFELRRERLGEQHEALAESRVALAEIGRLQGDPTGAVTALEALASQAENAEWSVTMRGEIHYQLAQARWDAGQRQTRVRADLERARGFLRDAGLGGDTQLRELEAWALDHSKDQRP